MKIYLVRHGETHANAQKKFAGHWDVDLTEKGMTQAAEASEKLKDIKFTHIYVSDLKRAKETAEAIALNHNQVPFTVTESLREMNFGDWEQHTFKAIGEENPVLLQKWFDDFENFEVPGGESVINFYNRIVAYFENLMCAYDIEGEDNILIVAHGGVIQSLMSYFCYGDVSGYWRFRIDNCRVTFIEYAMGMPVVQAVNQ